MIDRGCRPAAALLRSMLGAARAAFGRAFASPEFWADVRFVTFSNLTYCFHHRLIHCFRKQRLQ